jgi:hypothetical protein
MIHLLAVEAEEIVILIDSNTPFAPHFKLIGHFTLASIFMFDAIIDMFPAPVFTLYKLPSVIE